MRAVTNQRKQEYQLAAETRQAVGDGEIYQVQGRQTLWVKILNDNSKASQLQVENQLRSGMGGEGSPREIVYNRGRFVGYTFEKSEPVPEPAEEPAPEPEQVYQPERTSRRRSGGGLDGVKIIVCAVVAVALSALQILVFHPVFRDFFTDKLSGSQISVCNIISASGITAILAGIVMLVLAARLFAAQDTILFAVFMILAFLLGILAFDFVLMFLIFIVSLIVKAVIAIVPILILVAAIVFVLRASFRRKR